MSYYDRYRVNTQQDSPTQFVIQVEPSAYNHTIDIGPISATGGTITIKGRVPGGQLREIGDGFGGELSADLAAPKAYVFTGNYAEIQVTAADLDGGAEDFYVALAGC